MAHVHSIARLDGVVAVSPIVWFGGYYQEPRNAFAKLVVDPEAYFDLFPEIVPNVGARERFRRSRRAVIVAEALAAQFGWQTGDVIPIVADITPPRGRHLGLGIRAGGDLRHHAREPRTAGHAHSA